MDRSVDSLSKAILDKQIVIIEANEASLKDIGFGFIKAGIEALNIQSND